MAFFGILIILSFSILLLAELFNELIEGDNYEALARIIDKIDELIDGASTHIQRTANALKKRWKRKE